MSLLPVVKGIMVQGVWSSHYQVDSTSMSEGLPLAEVWDAFRKGQR